MLRSVQPSILLRRISASVALVAVSAIATAQETGRPFQLSGECSALGLVRTSGGGTGVTGIGIRADYRLTRRVDVEGRLLWFPTAALQEFEAQGGRTTQVALGLRGKFLRRKRASLYGVLLPEVLHFSDAIVDLTGPVEVTGGVTHFAMDWGIGAEINASDRWSIHADLTGPIYTIREVELFRSEPGPDGAVASLSLAPRILNPWQITAGVGYRIGVARAENGAETPVDGAWEVGGQIARTTSIGAVAFRLQTTTSLGAFASYRLAPAIYADAAVTFLPKDNRERSPWEGGYVTQVLGGAKVGARKDAYGIFGKLRLGVNSNSGAVRASDASGFTLSRSNTLVVDLGAVVERYLRGRMLVRFDAGDAISVYRGTTYTRAGVVIPQGAPSPTDSLQVTIGVGWLF